MQGVGDAGIQLRLIGAGAVFQVNLAQCPAHNLFLLARLLAELIQHLHVSRRLPAEAEIGVSALALQRMDQPAYLDHQGTGDR